MKPTEHRRREAIHRNGCGRSCCADLQMARQQDRRARGREAAAEIAGQLHDLDDVAREFGVDLTGP